MSRKAVLQEIEAERQRQDALFGGPAHDDQHAMMDWVGILVRHLGLAVDDGMPSGGATNGHTACSNPARYRRQLVRVAAVSVAAIEAFDRKVASYHPRQPQGESLPARQAPGVSQEQLAWYQLEANRQQETLLVIAHPDPRSFAEGSQSMYGVVESRATPWEQKNYAARVEPGT